MLRTKSRMRMPGLAWLYSYIWTLQPASALAFDFQRQLHVCTTASAYDTLLGWQAIS